MDYKNATYILSYGFEDAESTYKRDVITFQESVTFKEALRRGRWYLKERVYRLNDEPLISDIEHIVGRIRLKKRLKRGQPCALYEYNPYIKEQCFLKITVKE